MGYKALRRVVGFFFLESVSGFVLAREAPPPPFPPPSEVAPAQVNAPFPPSLPTASPFPAHGLLGAGGRGGGGGGSRPRSGEALSGDFAGRSGWRGLGFRFSSGGGGPGLERQTFPSPPEALRAAPIWWEEPGSAPRLDAGNFLFSGLVPSPPGLVTLGKSPLVGPQFVPV